MLILINIYAKIAIFNYIYYWYILVPSTPGLGLLLTPLWTPGLAFFLTPL